MISGFYSFFVGLSFSLFLIPNIDSCSYHLLSLTAFVFSFASTLRRLVGPFGWSVSWSVWLFGQLVDQLTILLFRRPVFLTSYTILHHCPSLDRTISKFRRLWRFDDLSVLAMRTFYRMLWNRRRGGSETYSTPPLQPTQMDAQGHPRARFVAYGILFNVIEAIFEFPFHSGDI